MDPTVRTPRAPRTRGASWKQLEAQTTTGRKGAQGVDSQHQQQDRKSVSSSFRKLLSSNSRLEKALPSAKCCAFPGSLESLGFLW